MQPPISLLTLIFYTYQLCIVSVRPYLKAWQSFSTKEEVRTDRRTGDTFSDLVLDEANFTLNQHILVAYCHESGNTDCCQVGQFRCESGQCIERAMVCDYHSECRDKIQ